VPVAFPPIRNKFGNNHDGTLTFSGVAIEGRFTLVVVTPAKRELIVAYAREEVSARLGNLVFQVHSAATKPDADGVHDLRVAIRRLEQSLLVFSSLLPKAETKRIRKQLRKVLDLAGAVRDIDIALELLDGAGVASGDPLRKWLLRDRKKAERQLIERIRKWSRSDFSAMWRSDLQLVAE
jgi:CHAD domain-containing protein